MANDDADDRSAMSYRELVAWSWREMPLAHENAANLLIHALAVPLFVFAHFLLVAGILVDARFLAAGLASIVASLALQKFGHSLERNPIVPFIDARDFLRRLYAEQFCNFWRFLFSGRWYASFKAGRGSA